MKTKTNMLLPSENLGDLKNQKPNESRLEKTERQGEGQEESEIWKKVPEFPYEASSLGRVRRIGRKIVLAPFVDSHGYLNVKIYQKRHGKCLRKISRIVLMAFKGLPPGRLAASHLNGNKIDNRPCNLEWESWLQNNRRKKLHGTEPTGEARPNHKLTRKQVEFIIKNSHLTNRPFAKKMGINYSTLLSIARGRSWKHVLPDFPRKKPRIKR